MNAKKPTPAQMLILFLLDKGFISILVAARLNHILKAVAS